MLKFLVVLFQHPIVALNNENSITSFWIGFPNKILFVL